MSLALTLHVIRDVKKKLEDIIKSLEERKFTHEEASKITDELSSMSDVLWATSYVTRLAGFRATSDSLSDLADTLWEVYPADVVEDPRSVAKRLRKRFREVEKSVKKLKLPEPREEKIRAACVYTGVESEDAVRECREVARQLPETYRVYACRTGNCIVIRDSTDRITMIREEGGSTIIYSTDDIVCRFIPLAMKVITSRTATPYFNCVYEVDETYENARRALVDLMQKRDTIKKIFDKIYREELQPETIESITIDILKQRELV